MIRKNTSQIHFLVSQLRKNNFNCSNRIKSLTNKSISLWRCDHAMSCANTCDDKNYKKNSPTKILKFYPKSQWKPLQINNENDLTLIKFQLLVSFGWSLLKFCSFSGCFLLVSSHYFWLEPLWLERGFYTGCDVIINDSRSFWPISARLL